jgi:hypothetical protein
MNRLEEHILEHFGTKESCARKMKISRWSLYRYIDKPDTMQLKHIKKLSQLTHTPICTLIN